MSRIIIVGGSELLICKPRCRVESRRRFACRGGCGRQANPVERRSWHRCRQKEQWRLVRTRQKVSRPTARKSPRSVRVRYFWSLRVSASSATERALDEAAGDVSGSTRVINCRVPGHLPAPRERQFVEPSGRFPSWRSRPVDIQTSL